jgi:3-oxoacyl-[acyl-carrier protein] reductase
MTIGKGSLALDGRVVVITGAAQGLGEAAASAVGSLGASLALCDRNGDELDATVQRLRASGVTVMSKTLDVRDLETADAWLREIREELGSIDGLVNNAGGTFWSPFVDVSAKGRDAIMAVNFTSVAEWIRMALPNMRDGASIVNVTSVEAWWACAGYAIYAAMKAAVESLTRSLALELSDRRIRVNAVAPDSIQTPGDSALHGQVHGAASEGKVQKEYGETAPLGPGQPEDCAGPIAFLLSDLARFMTGTTLHVDGGTYAASGMLRQENGTFIRG